jgi:hypothetical protein
VKLTTDYDRWQLFVKIVMKKRKERGLGFWSLMPLSTIF